MEQQGWTLSNENLLNLLEGFRKELLISQFIISIIGILGNVVLIAFIIKVTHLKTFEIFLLGLAASNLVMVMNVDIYDLMVLFYSTSSSLPFKACSSLRFLKVFGVTLTMYFTVLICVFRYQKLRDVGSRGNLPLALDNVLIACAATWAGMLLAVLLATPTFFITLDTSSTTNDSNCSMDIFHCPKGACPIPHAIYKYAFLLILILLPFVVVTGCSCLILRILLHQQKLIHEHELEEVHHDMHHHSLSHFRSFHRSTFAVLAAMGICQVTWTLYLTLYLAIDPHTFQFWAEVEFYITTLYATISPYVYGIGNNLFSLRHCIK